MNEANVGARHSRWQSVRDAVRRIVTDPEVVSWNTRVGITFFGQSGTFIDGVDCEVTAYSTPGELGVEIASVAELDHADAIIEAMDAVGPAGEKPTFPALAGALEYALESKGQGRIALVVLITDGPPTVCQDPESVAELADLAANAYAKNPFVRTLVVGMGPAACILQDVGTEPAINVPDGELAGSLLQALRDLTLPDIPCGLAVPSPVTPDGQLIDVTEPRVRFARLQAGVWTEEVVPQLNTPADCDGSPHGGFTLDDPIAPSVITLCPCTCEYVRTGEFQVDYICAPTD
jgi:hypothetical protein